MVINALNSGAHLLWRILKILNSPTWENAVEGQINLRDAVKGTISHENDKGKEYRLNEKTAVLIVRPRGWHLEEKHMQVDGKNMSGSLVDFGLYFFHNAKALLAKGAAHTFTYRKWKVI